MDQTAPLSPALQQAIDAIARSQGATGNTTVTRRPDAMTVPSLEFPMTYVKLPARAPAAGDPSWLLPVAIGGALLFLVAGGRR